MRFLTLKLAMVKRVMVLSFGLGADAPRGIFGKQRNQGSGQTDKRPLKHVRVYVAARNGDDYGVGFDFI